VALVAALFGFTDFFADARIRDIGAAWQHMIGNLIAVVLALVNWYIRYRSAPPSACSLGASGFHSSRCCCCYSTDGRDGRWCTGTTSAYRIPGPKSLVTMCRMRRRTHHPAFGRIAARRAGTQTTSTSASVAQRINQQGEGRRGLPAARVVEVIA
jgi:hypothetical protein